MVRAYEVIFSASYKHDRSFEENLKHFERQMKVWIPPFYTIFYAFCSYIFLYIILYYSYKEEDGNGLEIAINT